MRHTNLLSLPTFGITILRGLVILALLAVPLFGAAAQEPIDPPPPPWSVDSPTATYRAFLPVTMNTPCSQPIKNGGFEQGTDWVFVASQRPAIYYNGWAHSGSRSLRTGIADLAQRLDSRSEAYQDVFIPANTSQATLRLWLYPIITAPAAPEPVAPQEAQPAPEAGIQWADAPLAADTQYVVILDTNGNLLNTLVWWQPSNAQSWTYLEFNLASNPAILGKTIRILIGTYNNNADGATRMYADDVSLTLCAGTPSAFCYNLFDNPGFEFTRTWQIVNTAYWAAYSTERAFNGSRSMRTGITSGADVYSYSDAYQVVTIPSNATKATLNLRYFPITAEAPFAPEPGSSAEPDRPLPGAPQPGTPWPPTDSPEPGADAPDNPDVQYILLLDQNGNTIKTLMWQLRNYQAWTNFTYDLLPYRGQTIRVQFGTFNDRDGYKSAMFVDEAYVDTCTGTPPPPPPPPPSCSEYLTNGGFENNQAWEIPVTAYSAGYSTARWHSGARSMRSGIVNAGDNTYSYSDFRQSVTLPSSLSSASLGVWFYPISGEAAMTPVPEVPVSESFGDAVLASDVQYLLVLDAWGNWINTLYWNRTNNQSWVYKTFNLAGYKGQTIKLQFGTYNDGWSGVTALYVDDASLWVCP
jgi:hypothetical protein